MKTLITTAVAMTLLASSAMAYGEKHGYQPPVGGNGFGEGYIQETTDADEGMSGDDHEPMSEPDEMFGITWTYIWTGDFYIDDYGRFICEYHGPFGFEWFVMRNNNMCVSSFRM